MHLDNKREVVKSIFYIGILVSFLCRWKVLWLFLAVGFIYYLWTIFFPESVRFVLGPEDGVLETEPVDETKLERSRLRVLLGLVVYTLSPLILFAVFRAFPEMFDGIRDKGNAFVAATMVILVTGIPALGLYVLFAVVSHRVRKS